MDSDTPKTDDAARTMWPENRLSQGYGDEIVDADFARSLERENTKLKENNIKLKAVLLLAFDELQAFLDMDKDEFYKTILDNS